MRNWLSALRSLFRREATPPPAPLKVYLHQEVAQATAEIVASYGNSEEDHEGIAYWAGVVTDTAWVVTTVLAPEAITTRGSYNTTALANAHVISAVNKLHLQVLAQVHGHPGSWVGHSGGDNTGAFMPYTGFYSVILPFYGREGMLPLSKCGIHRFEDDGFSQLTTVEIERDFIVVPTAVDLRRKG
jgi:hypothetical protein